MEPARPLHPALIGAALLACLALAGVSVFGLLTAPTDEAVVAYPSEWVPERTVYHPGEEVTFTVSRRTLLSPGATARLVIHAYWEPEEKPARNPSYNADSLHRIIQSGGTVQRQVGRQLPFNMAPGSYRLLGWAETVSGKRPAFADYRSQPIQVLP